jgi:hypothetical protein
MIRQSMQAIGALAAILVVGALLIDEGEVVTLVTADAQARSCETRVWIVEIDGVEHLRAGSDRVEWLQRLRERPRVEIQRGHGPGAERRAYVASIVAGDPGLSQRIDRAMSAKYGFADQVWGRLARRGRGVPVQLMPAEAPPGASVGAHGSAAGGSPESPPAEPGAAEGGPS